MEPNELSEQLKMLAAQLETIQSQLEKVELPRNILEHFKRTVDQTRITLWAALSLSETELKEGVAHFRLKRTEEMCQQVGQDISGGHVTLDNPDLARFHTVLKDTVARIEALQRG